MNTRRPRSPTSDHAKQALDDLGAEPLSGSDFEDEEPDPDDDLPLDAGGRDCICTLQRSNRAARGS
jgi:hypothetical protein